MSRDEDAHEVASLLTPQFSLLVAAVMLFCAWYYGGHMAELKFNGKEALGEVVRIETANDEVAVGKNATPDNVGPFYPVLAFKDESGAEHKFTDRKGTMQCDKYSIGDILPVLYRSENPQTTAMVDRGMEMWKVSGIFAAFGLLFLLSALSRMQGGNRAV